MIQRPSNILERIDSNSMTEPENNVPANYDESWKAAIEQYFEKFVSFFFPAAHQAIALSKLTSAADSGYEELGNSINTVVTKMLTTVLDSHHHFGHLC
ncbi:MAG: hypothetical protein NHB32_25155 [Fischerella sp. CENA71]|nr:hypothetical protein [Fischerella sp. CENA71]